MASGNQEISLRGWDPILCGRAWCKEKQIRTPVEDMSLGQLDANLRRFYAEARKINGEMYSKKTLLGFRHAIERHLNHPPMSRSLKLSTDPRFKTLKSSKLPKHFLRINHPVS
ncbi:predicted protein [Nematostella vectensis]|uniref:Uncharacterized protein n=1 Tax=Nematostella vectensis TaxID=45351 RepID=A7RXZ0_NEMVE|nr:predicted protein [Nematostella vectensis]|eukprot:XP_001635770.1 predicted protein [Nematostella vectensis]